MKIAGNLINKMGCASCGALTVLPLDILQTKIISSNNTINVTFDEIKITFLMTTVFAIQNTVFDNLNYINSNTIKGFISAISATPLYIYLEIQRIYKRLGILPNYKTIINLLTIREIIVYVTLYNLIFLNIPYNKIIGSLISNTISYPLKIYALSRSYKSIKINFNKILITTIIEIIKSSIGDSIALTLLYK